jgi:mRNA interferase MazF
VHSIRCWIGCKPPTGGLVIQRGEIWWADLAEPRGSEPGFRRPVVVIQSDAFNRSRIGTVVIAAITSNLELADAPGNVRLLRRDSKLPRESVVNVSRLLTLDRRFLSERVGRLPASAVAQIEAGLRLVLSL